MGPTQRIPVMVFAKWCMCAPCLHRIGMNASTAEPGKSPVGNGTMKDMGMTTAVATVTTDLR